MRLKPAKLPTKAEAPAEEPTAVERVLAHKYYVDELYDAAIVQPTQRRHLATSPLLGPRVRCRLPRSSASSTPAPLAGPWSSRLATRVSCSTRCTTTERASSPCRRLTAHAVFSAG